MEAVSSALCCPFLRCLAHRPALPYNHSSDSLASPHWVKLERQRKNEDYSWANQLVKEQGSCFVQSKLHLGSPSCSQGFSL